MIAAKVAVGRDGGGAGTKGRGGFRDGEKWNPHPPKVEQNRPITLFFVSPPSLSLPPNPSSFKRT